MLDFLYAYGYWGMWFLQFAVGAVFIVHGWMKFKNKAGLFKIGGPVHGLVEVVGGALLIINWHVREVGLIFAVVMLGAIWFKKFKWHMPFTAHDKMGWEFDLVLLAANIYFMVH